jgi:hypothetical protein
MSQIPSQTPPGFLDPRAESLPPPPPPEQDFSSRLDGVIVVVSDWDVYLAKASCASIRHSMGNIPITLLLDDPNTDTTELERLPNVKRMVAREVVDVDYAEPFSGFWVKLVAFWTSPYERFLLIDADTLIWGDVRTYAKLDQFDFIAVHRFTNSAKLQTVEQVQRSSFDVEVIKKFDPALDWRGQEAPPSGAFFARRGVFTKENLMTLRQLDCWRCYDNGLLHYLVWRATREGVPRTTGYRFHLFPADHTSPPEDRFLPQDCKRPAIIHWITQKPKLGRRYRAFDDYRKLFLKMTGRSKLLDARLFLEDINVWFQRQRRSLNRRWQRIKRAKS